MLSITVDNDPGKAAAAWLAARIRIAVAARGRCTLALSGGRTPWAMLAALAHEDLPWERLWVLQTDERLAPNGDPVRNWTHIQSILAGKVPAEQCVPMPVTVEDSDIAAEQYATVLQRIAGNPPVIDIVHLGLGADGHTASLLPGSPLLDETERQVALTDEYQGYRRMTLTLPVLKQARALLWLVAGSDKAGPLAQLERGDAMIPAGRVQHDQAVLFADANAARLCHSTSAPRNVLAIDVGGSHVKLMTMANRERHAFVSGPDLTAEQFLSKARELVADWSFDAVAIGFPGPVSGNRPLAEPAHLGPGWTECDYSEAFGVPVRMLNDAAMQALGGYAGGKMLFLGLGTGLGSALISRRRIEPLELAHLPYRKERSYENYLGAAGLKQLGKKKWRKHVARVTDALRAALVAEYVLLGGGNAEHIDKLPEHCRRGTNTDAFEGGFRIWFEPGWEVD